jgi:DnaJ-class molecular chaperone
MKCTLCKGEGKVIIDDGLCVCPICEGSRKISKCKTCNGSGLTTISNNNSWNTGPCLICIGHGFVPKSFYDCKDCNNTGVIEYATITFSSDGSKELGYEKDYCDCNIEEW